MAAIVCDAEPEYRALLALVVSHVGLSVDIATDSATLLRHASRGDCDLVLADTALMGGTQGLERLRRACDAPVISLGAGAPEELLDAGADYHLAKPFSPTLLRATVQAALRRSPGLQRLTRQRVVVGGVVFEPVRRCLGGGRTRLSLTPREADLLEFLALNAGRVLSRRQIVDGAWGGVAEASDGAVVSTVYRLRRKLTMAGASARIDTVPGLGYRLVLDPTAAPRGQAPAALHLTGEPRSPLHPPTVHRVRSSSPVP